MSTNQPNKGHDVEAWLKRLHSLRPWKGVADFGLENIIKVASELGDPQDSFKTIHVAGTNGKGSTSAILDQILRESGKKIALLTSPHLERVNERIRINGVEISDFELSFRVREVFEASERVLGTPLSFFETVTMCGFLHSRQSEVDLAVVEVGLGGRLDATNIISKPECAVITSIGLDHVKILGEDKVSIAREKAGIIKRSTEQSEDDHYVVIGEVDSEIQDELESICSKKGARSCIFGKDYDLELAEGRKAYFISRDNSKKSLFELSPRIELAPTLRGDHQLRNASVAAAVALLLGEEKSDIEQGVLKAQWAARLESIEVREREFILDCAHNMQGIQVLTRYLKSRSQKVVLVVGMLETKNYGAMLNNLAPFAKEIKFIEPDSNRALSCEELKREISFPDNLTSIHYKEYDGLVRELIEDKYHGECVLITGSMYLVGKLRGLIKGLSTAEH